MAVRAAQSLRVIAKNAELDLSIAEYIRVWCAPTAVFVEEVRKDAITILFGEIYVVQGNAKLFANTACILQVVGGRAVAIVVFPVGHVQCLHVRAGLLQKDSSYRRVHTTGQTQYDLTILEIPFHTGTRGC